MLVGLYVSNGAEAKTSFQLLDENATYSLSPYFEILPERNTRYSIEEVISKQDEFSLFRQDNPNYGYSINGLWLHLTLDNVSNEVDWVFNINFSQNDYVDFYLVENNNIISLSQQGKRQGQQNYRTPVFMTQLPVNNPMSLYIRVENESSNTIVPIFVRSLPNHLSLMQIDSILWGLFYGGLAILGIYALVLFVDTREVFALIHVGFIITLLIWQTMWGGHSHLLFDEGIPYLFAVHSELFFLLIGICSGFFAISFLDTKVNAKRLHTLVASIIIMQCIVATGLFILQISGVWKHYLAYGAGLIAVITYIFAGIQALSNRFQPAVYFIIGWIAAGLGALIGLFSLLGILPTIPLYALAFQVGIFLQAGLFSVAIMEKNRGQLKYEVVTATNDLRNNMELIEEQNARLDIARKDAIKASQIKSQFLANMSHEIRTPLNAILGFSKELDNSTLPFEQKEQIQIINSAADNLLSIINDVLDFSKIEAGKLQLNNQPFSPLNLLEEMVTVMAKSAHLKGLDFVFENHYLPERLIGDEARLKQVLTNLLGNALKFTSTGYIKLSASSIRKPHGVVELKFAVTDTGIGISKKDKKKLFSAFSQVDDSLNRTYHGTGLGLVISQEIVRMMNGFIHLKSEPNQGSTFTVTVRTNLLSQRDSVKKASKWKEKKVVIFDPFHESRRAIARMLTLNGAQTTSIDSLTYMNQTTNQFDYLFVVLSNQSRYAYQEILRQALCIDARQKILWHETPESLPTISDELEHFDVKARLPVTPARLESLIHSPTDYIQEISKKSAPIFPNVKVLAVDDMSMNLMLLEAWFKDTDVSLTVAYSGEDAIELCKHTAFDLILMDIQMPNMNGITATKKIRKTELNIGTPVIAITAHAFKEELENLLQQGMDDYLPKPISIEALLDIMHKWCSTEEHEEIHQHQVLNLQLANKRANGNLNTSKILLQEFRSLIPESIEAIQALYSVKDTSNLLHEIHRLHGASCYTGAPEIQFLSNEIESRLKKMDIDNALKLIPRLLQALEEFDKESEVVLQNLL